MVKVLTEEQFKHTLWNRMDDVTDSAEPVLDIWPYVRQLNEQNIIADSILNGELVEYVYRTGTLTFDHVLLSGSRSNQYVVIVIDLSTGVIIGHYILDLNSEYGI